MRAYELIKGRKDGASLIFLCDHASNRLPAESRDLGLGEEALNSHIAYDIGAADVTRRLAQHFGAPAVLASWSRLLIDLNRGAQDPTLVMRISDRRVIPGNARIKEAEVEARRRLFHEPYHKAIEDQIAAARHLGKVPVLISVHSFTPSWNGRDRPWDVAVLSDRDRRLADPLLQALRECGFRTGDNEPYSGELEEDCLFRHGTANGFPHALIEIRQDKLRSESMSAGLAKTLAAALASALSAMGTPAIRFARPLALKGNDMDEPTRTELEAAVFRRLVAHLRERTDVQNIDLMNLAGFCRNCLGDWYREAAAGKGIALEKDEARALVYGMPPAEWKRRFQKEATPAQEAAFQKSQKTHS
ncbi:MAG: DUF1244 domain-containing protein [Alphaproteobacteria bacterium]|nr:DUF1244 domain-containing protein [Alphaproteobacteria bacterium]